MEYRADLFILVQIRTLYVDLAKMATFVGGASNVTLGANVSVVSDLTF